jgi:hypothetical protein
MIIAFSMFHVSHYSNDAYRAFLLRISKIESQAKARTPEAPP